MPLYPFRCSKCRKNFDALVYVHDRDEPQSCPKCNGSGHRVMTADFGFKMNKEGLLNSRHLKNDGVHTIEPDKKRKVFGVR